MTDWRSDETLLLIKQLATVGYYIDYMTARDVVQWLALRPGPLVLEGPPGGGKTSLAHALQKVYSAPLYRLQCFKGVGAREALYRWDESLQNLAKEVYVQREGRLPETADELAGIIYQPQMRLPGVFARAMQDPHDHTFILVDEVDKVEADGSTEAMFLQFFDEQIIEVVETHEQLTPHNDLFRHIIVTSNAGVYASSTRESLSHPMLRRGVYKYIPEPDLKRRYAILHSAAPTLPAAVLRDATLFAHHATATTLDKPIALSETKMWVRYLEYLSIEELTPESVRATMTTLVKLNNDVQRLDNNLTRIFQMISNSRHELADDLAAAEQEVMEMMSRLAA